MLAKENRLKSKKDFEKVFKNGKGISDNFIYLKFITNNLKNSRFGFIVSTKFSKRATKRNKMKRWAREAIKKTLCGIKNGLDIVIIVRPGLKAENFQELKQRLQKLLKKAKLEK